MKHKLFTLLLAMIASVGTMFAETYSGSCGEDLTWSLNTEDSVLIIRGTGAMADFQNATQSPWNGYSSLIQSVIMNDNVTTVSNYAFAFCSNLKNVSLNKTLTTIGEHAFFSCPLLESVVIPDNVIVIGYNAFAQCSWLTSVRIGNKVTTIGKDAFARCGRLSSVVMFNSVTSIGENAFGNCSALTTINIPNSITSIGKETFAFCAALTSIEIPESVTSIGENAFYGCSGLTSVTNKAVSPQTINANVFTNINLSSCTLYVPAESVEAYKAAEIWKEFGNIVAIEGDAPAPCIIASGTCGAEGDNLTWTLSCDGVLTISGTGAMADYEYVDGGFSSAPWNDYRETISSLEFQLGVTSIGKYAFYQCRHLTTITLPSSVISIGRNAFDGCANLISATIPNSVTTIGWYAFSACTNLSSVTIPESVTELGIWPFQHCSGLTSIDVASTNPIYSSTDGVLFYTTESSLLKYPAGKPSASYIIPDNTTSISDYAFEGSTHLTSVTIPNSVTDIRSYAFRNCENLASLTIPNSVTRIGGYAFLYCTGLTSVICKAITPPTIASTAFYGVDISIPLYVPAQSVAAYQAADVWKEFGNILPIEDTPEPCITASGTCGAQGDNLTWTLTCDSVLTISGTGAMADYSSEQIPQTPWNSYLSEIKSVVIEEGATNIGRWAFGNCTSLTSVEIPNSVTSIGNYAFLNCTGLTSVTIPNSVTSIRDGAFYNCTGLTSVTIPNSVTSIGNYAFLNCTGLTSVTIPNSVTSIGNEAFEGCTGLTSVTIGNSVTSIGHEAFEGCTGLTSVHISDIAAWCAISFGGGSANPLDNGHNLYVNEELVTDLVIPNSVTSIGKWAFYECTGLTSVTIPNSVTSIGESAFRGCSSLTSVMIPNSVTSIGDYAFNGCRGLTSVTIPDSVTSIGEGAFSGCTGLTSVTIPNSVTSIGYWTFDDCTGLTSVTIPNSVTSIGNYAFLNCTGLTSVTIPNSVTSIGDGAFYNCTGLTSVTIPNSVTSIGSSAFMGCTGLTSVTIPNSVTSIGDGAFNGCSNLNTITNYATIPQPLDPAGFSVFGGVPLTCTLYVPAESVASYQAADVWKDFYNILPIEGTEESNYATLADIYNMAADSVFTLGAFDVVYVASYQNGANMYIKDASGSGVIYMPSYGLQAGDHVEAGLQGKVHIYNGLYEITPISTKEELTITSGEAPAPMEATEAPSLANVNQYVVYKGVSFSTDTSFVEGTRHMVYGTWNGQEIAFYNQYHIGATLSTDKTYNITAVNSVYGTVLEVYPLAVEEVDSVPDLCVIASGTCGAEGDNLTWTLTCDSVLTISGTGEMADYEWNTGAAWYSNKESIKSVIIENGVTSIGVFAFKDCHVLLSVEIPNSVTSIGSQAFQGSGLSYVRIPSNVTSLGLSIFAGCSDLSSIDVDVNNPYYCSIDGVLFKKYNTILKQYPGGKQGAYAIPNGVTSIEIAAFYGCSGLTSVEIPYSVTSIGEWAFYSCSSLTSIDIPNSVTSIGRDAFWNCTGLTSVSISNSVTSIGEETFADCISLTSFTNYALQPQMVNSNVFVDVDKSACTLYVPAESVEAYQTADVWKEFGTILPIGGQPEVNDTLTIVEAIQIGMALDSMETSVETYTIEGYVINAGTINQSFKYQNWYMADDPNVTSSDFQAYRCYPIDGLDTTEVRNGSKVRMTGKLHKYYDRTKALYVVEMINIPATILSKPQIDTITVAEALAIGAELAENANTAKQYVIRGYVSSVTTPFSEQNGDQNFYIADDSLSTAGSTAAGGFYVYRGKPATGTAIKEGALVEITCAIKNYRNINIENHEYPVTITILQDGPECRIITGTCGDNLTWTFNNCDSVLTISGTGAMDDYTSYSATPWSSNRASIKFVIIEDGVTSIGSSAFYGCTGLTSVTIGNSVTSIGNYAFENCTGLTSVTIPNSVTSIGAWAFEGCTGLTSVTIPNSVTSIGDGAFGNCTGLTSPVYNAHVFAFMPTSYSGAYTIPDGIESIAGVAFSGCSGLTSVTIPNSVTSIGYWAFGNCTSLTSVTIPDSVTSIGNYAFYNCSGLTSVTIPNSLTSIGDGAFGNCTGLTSPVYNAHVFAFMPTSYSGAYTIPDGIESIAGVAFSGCSGLTSVTIPNSVTSIGWCAFRFCSGLTSVTIPNSVTSIGEGAFYKCRGLTFVTIPNSVTSIGYEAFYYCTGLTSVTIPNSVTSIGYSAFYNCTGLTSVTIPNSVTSIGESAFRFCTALTSVTIEAETPPTLDSYAFDNTNNSPIYVPCGTLDAYKSAWSDYADRIKYEVEYTIIGNVNDAKAGSVDYPTSACGDVVITAIPNYGYHFTQWSDGLKDNPRIAQITQDTTFTAEFAYDRVGTCGKDLALVWSYDPTNKVLTIGNAGSFTENMQFGVEAPNGMEELVIGNSVTAIGANAFAGIETLKKVSIGESVKTIGEQAFYNCVNLETIFNYRPTPTNTYSNAFDGVDKFECTLYVLPNSIDMYKNAAVWRDFYYTYAIGAEETTVTTNDVTVEPQDNAATLTWPTSNNAASYTIQITKDGVVFCTLIFNSNGQLTGIAFAPSRDGQAHAPAALMTANGLQFTVTGLDSGTQYGYSVTAKDANDQTVATYSGSFTTTSEGIATGIDNTPFPSGEGRGEALKLLRDGQIFILRGEKVYNAQGALVK